MISTIPGRSNSFDQRPPRPGRTPRILDPERLLLQGAVIDWISIWRNGRLSSPAAEDIARERGISPRVVQLRWLTNPALGYPTEPFKVWRRPSFRPAATPLEWTTALLLFGFRMVTWEQPQIFVSGRFQSSGGGTVLAFSGAPLASSLVDSKSLPNDGINIVQFEGPSIKSLLLSPGVSPLKFWGVDPDAEVNSPRWELLEQVGLPAHWPGVLNLDQPQGLVGSLGNPVAAALDRYRRGAPFYGWRPEMAAGAPAPPWRLANPDTMIKALTNHSLDDLREMITTHIPAAHQTFELAHELPPAAGGRPAITRYKPLETLIFGAATDPLLSLISGFGTAFDQINETANETAETLSKQTFEYMVTARYENGHDGDSAPVEYAAILYVPDLLTPPPPPINVKAETAGHRAPARRDLPWRSVVRLTWNKPLDIGPFRVGSYAAARFQPTLGGTTVPLMDRRLGDTALQPISATTSDDRDLKREPLEALDDSYSIISSPAINHLRYGLAHQDWFGLWSPWTVENHSVQEPEAQRAALLSARLNVTAPASGSVCPGTLVVDLAWDWKVRSPRRLELVGRLYPQTKRDDPPPNSNRPNHFPSALGQNGGSPFRLVFNGEAVGQPDNHPTLSGVIEYLSDDGKSFLPAPPELAGTRRYRLAISGFSLDYANTGHIGLALWARGQENRAPQRQGPWTSEPLLEDPEPLLEDPGPLLVSASDPRPPVITGTHENVQLASIADAKGEHHALLSWPTYPGADGYVVYTSTETQLRADRNLPEPLLSQTLSERLVELRDAFEADPNRRSFTRINDTQIEANQLAITLPRGSKEIHLYLVIGVSAGQIESAWPDASDPDLRRRPMAYAPPQIVAPSPPLLEVSRVLDETVNPPVYRAQVQIQTRPGASVSQIDLHRVRVPAAALDLDTMGPAIASLTGSAGTWQVAPHESDAPGEAQALGVLTGVDNPGGSWKRVFYRAVAWSADIPERGIYRGRSLPSAAREVVIPPQTPPDLSSLTYRFQNRIVRIRFTSAAPVATTPLGPHRIRATVYARSETSAGNGRLTTLYRYPPAPDGRLASDALEEVSPQPVPLLHRSNQLWRSASDTPGVVQYELRIWRAASRPELRVTVQLIDPLGRLTEQTLTVPGAS